MPTHMAIKLTGACLIAFTVLAIIYSGAVTTQRTVGRQSTLSGDASLLSGNDARAALTEPSPSTSDSVWDRHIHTPDKVQVSHAADHQATVSQLPPLQDLSRLNSRHGNLSREIVHRLAQSGNLSLVWQQDSTLTIGAQQGAPIAFFKTHKTGSTTVGAIFFRYAARHGMRIADAGELVIHPSEVLKASATGDTPDIALGHLTTSGGRFNWHSQRTASDNEDYSDSPTKVLNQFYANVLQGPTHSIAAAPVMVTVIRHPAERTRSHYDYYVRSAGNISSWIRNRKNWNDRSKLPNFQCQELGLTTERSVDAFVADVLAPGRPFARSKPGFQLVMVAEKMIDSLLLLRRLLLRHQRPCDILDLLHLSQPMARNWKGRKVSKTRLQHVDRQELVRLNPLDVRLWDAASARIDELVQLEMLLDNDNGTLFRVERSVFLALQRRLGQRCQSEPATDIWIRMRQSVTDPTAWFHVSRPRILGSMCEWFAFGDETYTNLGRDTNGVPHTAYADSAALQPDAVLAILLH